MPLLKEKDRAEILKHFATLQHPVRLVNFTQSIECQFCTETRQILEEVAALSDKITLEVHDFVEDSDIVKQFGIDKIPATAVVGKQDRGIRFYGIPAGYEFSSLIESIIMVSADDSGLAPETRKALEAINGPLHLQVFVTPTCPYCPRAVSLAHQFAMESDLVTADMVEATEFPDLANRYAVMGVPKTVANEESAAEGALPETALLERVLKMLEKDGGSAL